MVTRKFTVTEISCDDEYAARIGGVGRRGGWRRPLDVLWPSNMAPITTKLCQNAFQTIPVKSIFGEKKVFSPRFFGLGNRFAPFWTNFGGSTEKRTSTANSSQFFALDAPIMSSVRPKIVGNMSVGALGSEMHRSNPPCPQPHQCGQGIHAKRDI